MCVFCVCAFVSVNNLSCVKALHPTGSNLTLNASSISCRQRHHPSWTDILKNSTFFTNNFVRVCVCVRDVLQIVHDFNTEFAHF